MKSSHRRTDVETLEHQLRSAKAKIEYHREQNERASRRNDRAGAHMHAEKMKQAEAEWDRLHKRLDDVLPLRKLKKAFRNMTGEQKEALRQKLGL